MVDDAARIKTLREALTLIANRNTPEIEYRCVCGLTSPGSCDGMGACRWNRPRVPERIAPDKYAKEVLKQVND